MKTRHVILGMGLFLSASLVMFGDTEAEIEVVESAASRPRAAASSVRAPDDEKHANSEVLRLVPRNELIGAEFSSAGDGAFGRWDWTPPPPPPPEPPPPPPPMAPQLPFTYLGKALIEGRWEAYVAQGERMHVLRQGDVIDGVYRVDVLAPPNLSLTYLPLGQQQQMNIGVSD